MAFPTHGRHPALGSTPSSGKAEVRRALLARNKRPFRNKGVTPARLRRRGLRLRNAVLADAAVQAVLDALVTDGDVATAGGKYWLTAQGLAAARNAGGRPRAIGAFRQV